MNKNEARERIEKLKKTIDKHRYLYHVLDRQEISDEALDSLKKELFDLEQEYPEFITSDSPTQRVGGKPLPKFNKVKHESRMYSLNDAFSEKDIFDWLQRLDNVGVKNIKEFYSDLKMDGLAIELVYENGLFKLGSTRGDGVTGEDVTQNLKTIGAIPLKLASIKSDLIPRLVVRGEVFFTKKEFERVNREQASKGEKIYANPRNVAAGSIRQLDPKITASRKLDFYAYSIVGDIDKYPTKDKEYEALREFGIKTNPHGVVAKSPEEIIKLREKWEKEREKLDYEIDGLVVSINDKTLFERAGTVGKAPRGAVAYKFSPKQSETTVENIIVSVGRTGTLTPIAALKPVNIGGVTVSRATLHNIDEVRRLDIRIGDTVIVGRAGDVIPDVIKVLKELRTGKEKIFNMPKKCPACGSAVEQIQGQVAYKCTNQDCPAIKREAVYHFVSRRALDMVGIGPKIIDQLMNTAIIHDSADLYKLTKQDLLSMDRLAERSAEKAIDAIQSKKKVTLAKFIYALGISNVGEETAVLLAKKFNKISTIKNTSLEDLQNIHDIGPVVAESIYNWFQKPYNKKLLEKFEKVGLHIMEEKVTKRSTKLTGLTFVLTGTLEKLGREEAKEKIRSLGGNISSSVSKKTSYVVAGSDPGSKYDEAQKLEVKIISEDEFLKMLD